MRERDLAIGLLLVFAVTGPQSPRAGHALVAIDGALYLIESGMGVYAPMEMLRPQP